MDFRRKIFEIKELNRLNFEEAALRFSISKSGGSRRAKRLEPCRTRNRPAAKIDLGRLIRDVEEHPGAFSRSVRSGTDAADGALKRLKIGGRKNFSHPKAKRSPAAPSKEG